MRRISLFLVSLFAITQLAAQSTPQPGVVTTNDFRARIEAGIDWEPVKNLSLEAGLQLRLNDDLRSIDRAHANLGLNYDVCDYFNVGAEYIHISNYDAEAKEFERPRHRLNLNLEGSVKVGRVKLSLRERLQTTFRTDSVNRYEKMNPEMILRSRLQAEYGIRNSRWTPYILFELHNTLNAPAVVSNYKYDPYSTENYITRYRAGVGAKFRISRKHRLNFYYYFDYDRSYEIDYKAGSGRLKGYIEENEFRHIFGISYKFKP
ncbi:MAG: DUF2490 domain-containing protein [Alistipes sp.]|nr:DUF2490 domain-containing protein [Alistipes sp.]